MDELEMQAKLERLRAENAKLKSKNTGGLSLKVSEKGAVSLYGMGRFPVTLYKEQSASILASALQFSDATTVYAAHVAPQLADYMRLSAFEEICDQWLQRNAQQRLGLSVREMARYWSRDGRTEIDLMAELDSGTFLFGECKWRTERSHG